MLPEFEKRHKYLEMRFYQSMAKVTSHLRRVIFEASAMSPLTFQAPCQDSVAPEGQYDTMTETDGTLPSNPLHKQLCMASHKAHQARINFALQTAMKFD